jgi:hypothetical protein
MDHQKTSRFRKVSTGWLMVPLIALLPLLCCAYLFYPAIRARYLFRQLETLQLQRSTFEDAQRLARKIGAKPYTFSSPCSRSWCEWVVRTDNSELPRWWRGSGEVFVIAFDVKDSVVVRKNTGFGIEPHDGFSPSSVGLIEQEDWGHTPRPVPVAAGWKTSELYRYYEFTVYMTPDASAEERRRYTSFNFNCFWRYQGCKDGREMLPIAGTYPPGP